LEGITLHKFMEIVVCILAIVGFACVVKHIMHCKEGCCLCGLHKTKGEDEKMARSTSSYKIKVD
jgi:hypothetical protein